MDTLNAKCMLHREPHPQSMEAIYHGTLDRPIQEEEKMADSINGSDYGILNWDSPTRVPPNAEPSSPDVSSPHAPGRLCQRLAQTIYQSSLDYR